MIILHMSDSNPLQKLIVLYLLHCNKSLSNYLIYWDCPFLSMPLSKQENMAFLYLHFLILCFWTWALLIFIFLLQHQQQGEIWLSVLPLEIYMVFSLYFFNNHVPLSIFLLFPMPDINLSRNGVIPRFN